MKIIISGLAGTGTSTLGKKLAEHFNIEFISTGNIYRSIAKEHFPEADPAVALILLEEEEQKISTGVDIDLDNRVVDLLKSEQQFVLDSRLAWFFAKRENIDSIKILLYCPDEIRIKRIADREEKDFDLAYRETIDRESSTSQRFKDIYDVNFFELTNPENFDLVIDTSISNIEDMYLKAIEFIK